VQIGAQISESHQRIQAEQQRAQMEAQAREITFQRESQLQQARLQTESAYKQQQLALEKQRLEQVGQINAAKLRDTALKAADQSAFAQDLAGGMSIEQALYRHPRLATPGAAIQAHRDTQDATGRGLDLRRQALDLSRERLEASKQAQEDRKEKPPTLSELQAALKAEEDPDEQERLRKDIRERIHPSTPMTMENAPEWFKKAVASSKAALAANPTSGKRVRVKAPDGSTGTVPSENLEHFLRQGYSRVE